MRGAFGGAGPTSSPAGSPASSDLRAELAALFAHQLRNRLAKLVFGVEALTRAAGPDAELSPAAARVRRSVEELVCSFDQLVELVRVLSGREALRTERVELVGLVAGAVERLRPSCLAREQTLLVQLPELPLAPMWVDGEPAALEVALWNLLANALVFTPPGGRIEVVLRQDGARAQLVVRDDGVGIAPAQLERIFELYALDERAPGSPNGVHAGLFVARAVVALHGGEIVARSDGEGRGSEFILSLPCAENDAPLLPSGSLKRALVLVPHAGLAGLLAALLRSWGYHVRSASDEASADVALLRYSPTVVLIDAELSARDGDQLPRRLRARLPDARLVLVGADGGSRAVSGLDAVVRAPIEPDLLHAALRRT